jgi:hypothetical protein
MPRRFSVPHPDSGRVKVGARRGECLDNRPGVWITSGPIGGQIHHASDRNPLEFSTTHAASPGSAASSRMHRDSEALKQQNRSF